MLIFSVEKNRVSWLRVTFVWDTNSVIQNRKSGEIDLHGLYVKEAIAYTDAALKEAKLRGDSEIRLIVGTCRSRKSSIESEVCIVGKGLHSEWGTAKVGPAIKNLMRKYVGVYSASNPSSTNLIRTDTS